MVGTIRQVLWLLKYHCHLTFLTCSLSHCKKLSSLYGLHAIVYINAAPLWELCKFLLHAVVCTNTSLLWQLYEGWMKSSGTCVAYKDIFYPMKNITCLQYSHLQCGQLCLKTVGGNMLSAEWLLLIVTRGHRLTACIVFSTVQNHFPQKGSFGNRSESWTHVWRLGRMLQSFPLSHCQSCYRLATGGALVMRCRCFQRTTDVGGAPKTSCSIPQCQLDPLGPHFGLWHHQYRHSEHQFEPSGLWPISIKCGESG
jgi:hypothetical protein